MTTADPFAIWMQRVRQGDPQAAAHLVEQYEPYIRRAARSRLRSRVLRRVLDSIDICQSVLASLFLRTSQGQFTLESPDQLQKLLVRMVRNKVADAWRRYAARILQADDVDLADIPAPETATEGGSHSELLELVQQSLSVEDYRLFQDRAQGYTWKQIGEQHGMNPEALRKRLSRALDELPRQE